jgi:hypothetical protein
MTTPEEFKDDPKNPDNVHLSDHMGLFLDFGPPMERYMKSLGVDKLAARSGLKRKAVNTIVPVVSGLSLHHIVLAIEPRDSFMQNSDTDALLRTQHQRRISTEHSSIT